jgi:hypothetical protein
LPIWLYIIKYASQPAKEYFGPMIMPILIYCLIGRLLSFGIEVLNIQKKNIFKFEEKN